MAAGRRTRPCSSRTQRSGAARPQCHSSAVKFQPGASRPPRSPCQQCLAGAVELPGPTPQAFALPLFPRVIDYLKFVWRLQAAALLTAGCTKYFQGDRMGALNLFEQCLKEVRPQQATCFLLAEKPGICFLVSQPRPLFPIIRS